MGFEKTLELTYRGNRLGDSTDCFLELQRSDDALHDREELERRMEEDGYLFLPSLLNEEEVIAARQEVMDRMMAAKVLDKRYSALEGIAATGAQIDPAATGTFMPVLAKDNPPLEKVLYDGPMMAFYEHFLGGPVRHYDYTWFRAKRPGIGTATMPHCDIVYMGRGTKELFTSWVPYGDVPFEKGGLMLLEGSHKQLRLKQTYGSTDVDLYCENEGNAREIVETAKAENRSLSREERQNIRWNSTGSYSEDAIATQMELGGRWMTTEFKTGDLLVFCMYMIHASSDNSTDRVRISSDSRYQLASQPVDERWIGDDPPAHGIRAKRGMVC